MDFEFKYELKQERFDLWEDLNLTNILFLKENVNKMDVDFQTFREVCFQNCKFDSVTFNNVFMVKVKFINCEFSNVTFTESNFNNTVYNNCKFTNVSFFQNELENVLFLECLMQYSKIGNNKFKNSKFDDVCLKENVHSHNDYFKINFYKCDIVKDIFMGTEFRECDLKTSTLKEIDIDINELKTSTISLLSLLDIINEKGIIIE